MERVVEQECWEMGYTGHGLWLHIDNRKDLKYDDRHDGARSS